MFEIQLSVFNVRSDPALELFEPDFYRNLDTTEKKEEKC